MSPANHRLAGILLVALPTVVYGGVSILSLMVSDPLIRSPKIRIGVDPLGSASVHYCNAIAQTYGLNLTVVNDIAEPTFSFMPLDWDGQIRMDQDIYKFYAQSFKGSQHLGSTS